MERYIIDCNNINNFYQAFKELDKVIIDKIKDICCINNLEKELNSINNQYTYNVDLVAFNTIEVIKQFKN